MKSSNTLEKDYDFEGFCKIVKGPDADGYLYKYFKKHIKVPSLTEQKRLLELKKQYFWKYIPETELCETEDGNYFIKQKYIQGQLLKDLAMYQLSSITLWELIDLLNSYLSYCKNEKKPLDIIGYQPYPKEMKSREKKFRNAIKLYKNFLASSNIIVANNGKVYMIDVCDDMQPWGFNLQSIKSFCSMPFIYQTLSDLKFLLSQKQKDEPEIWQKKKSDYT